MNLKNPGVLLIILINYIHIKQIDVRTKDLCGHKEGCFIVQKRSTNQEDMTNLNVYAPHNGTSK